MPTPANIAKVQAFASHPFQSDLRAPSADELVLIAEALDAGALIVPRLWREYFTGEIASLPVQFEGCAYSVHPGDQWAREIVSANIAKRDAFLERVQSGDLRPYAARIETASQREAA